MDANNVDKERMDQILRVDVTALLKTIQNLENKLSQSPVPVNIPIAGVEAIFSKLESRLSTLEILQQQIYQQLGTQPTPMSPGAFLGGGTRNSFESNGANIHSMAIEEKLMAKLRGEIEAKINASQLSFDSKINSFAFEVDRLQKLLTIRPTTSELQQVIFSVTEMDRKMRDGVEIVQINLMGQLKNIVAGEMSSIMHEIKTTKVLNEQSIGLVSKKIDAQTVDVAEVKVALQNTVDVMQPEIRNLKQNQVQMQEKLTMALQQSKDDLEASKVRITQVEETIANANQSLAEQKEEYTKALQDSMDSQKVEMQTIRELITANEESCVASAKTLQEFKEEFATYKTNSEQSVFNLEALSKEHSEKIENEATKRRILHGMLDEIIKQDLQGKLAKHDENLNKINYDLVDSRVLIDSLSAQLNAEVTGLNKAVKSIEEDIKSKVRVVQTQHSEKINQLFQFDQVNKSNIDHLSHDLSHIEKTTENLLSLRPRVSTLEDICTVLDKDLNSSKEALTTVIDGNQDLARLLSEASEKIEEIDESIVNRMNSVRDNLMEVLLEKQTETNLNLKNVRENLEVMALAGDGGNYEGGFPAMGMPVAGPSLSAKTPGINPSVGFKRPLRAGGEENVPARHVHMDASSKGSSGGGGQYSVVDNKDQVAAYRKPTMDGVMLKGLNMQANGKLGMPLSPQQEEANRHSNKLAGVSHSQSQPLLPSQQLPQQQQVKVVKDRLADKIHGADQNLPNPSLSQNMNTDHYILFTQAQFVAELCINFEDISVKKKRVTNIPPVLCQSIAAVTQELTEFMAKTADAEMVQYMILIVSSVNNSGPVTKDETLAYDENFVLTRRHFKMEEFLSRVSEMVSTLSNTQPGIVRHDARTIFLAAVKKSLDMFMTKHNQVLTVGNSRLGRIKIPTCIACDRPLIDKVSLETAAGHSSAAGGRPLLHDVNNDDDDNTVVSSKYGP